MAERPLIGLSPDQVSTNGMLGDLAFQDSDSAYIETIRGKVSLDKLDKSIEDTAVDIFVYDTRKDSDGGAWRKRTQHTSWYNETLNTATRGSRRDFPAVAVLVLSANKLTIYDGDDPDLPMWMEAYQYVNGGSGGTTTNWHGGSGTFSSVAASNGIIICGASGGCRNLHFVNDRMSLFYTPASGNYTQRGGISDRNDSYTAWSPSDQYYAQLASAATNDVAMTVLPSAPIDDATGLPIPTIAVATDGGVSVIKDDRTDVIISRTSDDDVHYVDLDGDRVIMFMELGAIYVATIPSADQSGDPNAAWSVYGSFGANTSGTDHPAIQAYGAGVDLVSMKDHTFATAGYNTSNDRYKGLSILSENVNSSGNGMVAWAHTDFNTGWMHGDIRSALLSDTDDTDATKTELIDLTNGSIPAGNNAVVANITANQLDFQTTSESVGRYWTGTTLETGKQYHATLTISNYTGSGDLGVASGGGFDSTFRYSANGTYTRSIVGDAALQIQLFYRNTNTATIGFEIHEAEYDRSVNQKGLGIYGTVTKTPVATGAELVAYSGWSASNYLEQPPTSNIYGFGAGDFSIIFWVNYSTTANYKSIITVSDGTAGGWGIRLGPNTPTWQFWDTNAVRLNDVDGISGWQQVAFIRSGATLSGYVNGKVINTRTDYTTDLSSLSAISSSSTLRIGNSDNSASSLTLGDYLDDIALLRLSDSAPSPEQIKKIYEDEKVLFQENAACTLYGSSDAVTALAYDDSTNLLYVGTSSGRSDFQGLRRINNTTDAVSTAISASNGLVAEQ